VSIRLRLTLLYSVILALTLIAFSTILYVAQSQSTYNGIRGNLVRQAGIVSRRPPGSPPGSPVDAGRFGDRDATGTTTGSNVLPGRWTQTRSITGTIIAQTPDLIGTSLPLSGQGLKAVQSGSAWFETVQVQGEPLMVYNEQYVGQSGTTRIVQVAFPIAQPLQSLNGLRLILIIGSSLVTMAAFGVGWVLAGTALRPIHRITHTAQAIGAEHDFSRRVEHTGPADEVGQLAITFNEMLGELESAYRQLESALESQQRFVADASHELRTPLTTVRGNIELLQRQPPMATEDQAEVMADTRDEVDRLIRLVNQLLLLARTDAGPKLRCEPLALEPLMEDVCRQARLLAPKREIVCEVADDTVVLADRDALKQVLLILLDNAQVHTPPGAAIRMQTGLDDGHVTISVADQGPGIAPNVLAHIFERFYRGDASRTGRGTGLGLAIAKELVEAQDGTISASSKVGQGTLFAITLPQASG
jgi:two-component system, OmpR family, sensor kinase